jgi:Ca2+-transporting ATPase
MFYNKNVREVIEALSSSIDGLSESDALKRLEEVGLNKIDDGKYISKLSIFLKQFQDSMIIMLLIVSIISFFYSYFMHESYTDSILIIFIVFLNALMGYFQESRAAASINSLKNMSTCSIKVKRDNVIYLIDSCKLVPGDIVILEAGDKIPCDCRVIEATSALVDESVLTGESVCVSKKDGVISESTIINDRYNMIYSGSSLVNGKIVAIVVSTGMNTELGNIATSVGTKKDVPTPLQLKISEISRNLSLIVIFIIGFVFVYNILFLKSNLLDIVMLCISLMVSAVPEGLPCVISITLSLGVSKMAKKNALVRTLSSVETLGAVDIICSDKTGTITKNQMTVIKTFSDLKEDHCSLLLSHNMVLCNDSEYSNGKFIGDPTETALMEYVDNSNDIISKYRRIVEVPFDSDRKMMSTINSYDDGLRMFVKGSLESILEHSISYVVDGEVRELNDDIKNNFFSISKDYSSESLRVIGFAYRDIYESDIDDDNLDLECNLIFVGMVGMIDPARDGVEDSILMCKSAGIIPIMITGDSLSTALAISKKIGLCSSDSEGIEGGELSKYSDSDLVNLVKKYRVYARVSPSDKVRIVKAWQSNNKVVAMTGDGVNDAPSIKLAHIGIGMGKGGTEVTKSVADVLLLDDCFNTIVGAVREGRRIYSNIRNVILYSLSSNFAELFIVIIGMFMGINILLPIQILFIDLFTDAILSICMAFEHESPNIMDVPPHKSSGHFFTPFMTCFLGVSAMIECLLIFVVYILGYKFYGEVSAQSMAFLCLIIQEMVFAYNCRNLKEKIINHGLFSNKIMNIGIIGLTLVQFIIFFTPISSMLHIVTLEVNEVLIIIVLNIIAFLFIEVLKPIISKKFSD